MEDPSSMIRSGDVDPHERSRARRARPKRGVLGVIPSQHARARDTTHTHTHGHSSTRPFLHPPLRSGRVSWRRLLFPLPTAPPRKQHAHRHAPSSLTFCTPPSPRMHRHEHAQHPGLQLGGSSPGLAELHHGHTKLHKPGSRANAH